MVKKFTKQKYRTLNTKTCKKFKPTQNNNVFHLNLLDIIFGHFVVVSHQYRWKI